MPVAQGSRDPARQAILVGLGALLGLAAIVFLVTQLDQLSGGGDTTEFRAGDPIFSVGEAASIAPAIAERGPLLLQDAAQGDRDIWLNHLGTTDDRGWVAFAARPEGADRECFVNWEAETSTFVDVCDGTVYPPDGDGLQQYAVSVNPDGDVTINLNLN